MRAWTGMPVFDDVGPALTALREAGWRLAILTNCDDDLIAGTQEHLPVELDMVVDRRAGRELQARPRRTSATFRERVGRGAGRLGRTPPAAGSTTSSRPTASGVPSVWVDRDRSGHPPAIATEVLPDMTGLAAAVERPAGARTV